MTLPTSFQLNNGSSIPAIGFGTFQSKPDEVGQAVETALKAGYRHIDCASIYGNEKEVGAALKKSRVPRNDVFLTGKLWNNKHRAADVEAALDQTLQDLGVSHLDLYLVHWPVLVWRRVFSEDRCANGRCSVFQSGDNPFPLDNTGVFALDDVPVLETWAAMEKVLASGKAKSIGVSNFNVRRLGELLAGCTVVPAVNQIEAHPYLQQPELVEYCRSKGILVEAYSPMGNNETHSPRAIDDPAIQQIAKNVGMDVGQLLVSWAVQRGTVVLPKSVTESRIKTNFEAKELPADVFAAITAMERHHRYNFPPRWGVNVFDELDMTEVEGLARQHASDNLSRFPRVVSTAAA